MRAVVTLCALLVATPVVAQELRFSPAEVESCLADEGGSECAGLAAVDCMEHSPGGHSTVGMAACLDHERIWWDDRLNAAYKALTFIEKRADDAARATGNGVSRQDALREMQRAWIAYRDATCTYVAVLSDGGTAAGPAALSCLLEITAEQALRLQSGVTEAESR